MTRDPWLSWPEDLRAAALPLLRLALDEDLGDAGDLSARNFDPDAAAAPRTARLVAREPGVLAGLPLFLFVFRAAAARLGLAPPLPADGAVPLAAGGIRLLETAPEGLRFNAGETLASLAAPPALLHAGERTALNFLQRLCAVATATSRAVAASCGPAVLDTRKTTPGYRRLEKYAVRMGGGRNHRMGLYDAIMVKDNHKEALGGMAGVMERVATLPLAPERQPELVVEVDSLEELQLLLAHPAARRVNRVLLDNFPPEQVAAAVALRQTLGGGPDFEISGGLRAEDLSDPRYAGVEAASLGSITHGAGALDLALELEA
ncbi:MAG: nicotinate-nucleotide diphosphorylase (carboxylating) [Candidatus Krumholzibacteriia bacterium]|nr:nicotinate-nucleotide diphosphorylase (carboxylating) [bacterium]MCB9514909.1 nicotinate-nucleotide diphosphorylase (carboxylating) [Candidatus Latescibacterota bacterium]